MSTGMVGTEADEQSRPEFSGIPSVHAVTGQPIRYFPRNAFLFRVFLSTNVISVLICVVIAVIASIFFLRIVLSRMQVCNLYVLCQWAYGCVTPSPSPCRCSLQ